MTERRPLDSNGNPPMPGQLDVYDVVNHIMSEDDARSDYPPIAQEPDRPPTAAEIVAARLKGK